MGSFSKGASVGGLISWPVPVKHKILANYSTITSNQSNLTTLPDLSAADGTVWAIDYAASSAAAVQRIGPTGAVIYTIVKADINALAVSLLAVLVDYTDAKLYMLWSGASGNAPYFASTPLTTKTPAVVALTTTFTGGLQQPFLDRVGGQGAGNLTIYSQNYGGPALEKRDINISGTLQGTTAAVLFGSVTPLVSTGNIYVSQAGNLNAEFSAITNGAAVAPVMIRVSRNGSYGILSTASTNRPISSGFGNTYIFSVINGNNITFVSLVSSPNYASPIIKTIARVDFDAFLNQIADSVGCL